MTNLAELFPNQQKNLDLLVEESAEVIHQVMKCNRFGLGNHNPTQRPGCNNRIELERELGDLMAIIDILDANGTISKSSLEMYSEQKINKLKQWYNKEKVDA